MCRGLQKEHFFFTGHSPLVLTGAHKSHAGQPDVWPSVEQNSTTFYTALSNAIVTNVEFLIWNVVTVQGKPEADALIE
jgi:hypothetical protein